MITVEHASIQVNDLVDANSIFISKITSGEMIMDNEKVFISAANNNLKDVYEAIDKAFDLNTQNETGQTLLHVFTIKGDIDTVIRLLKEKGKLGRQTVKVNILDQYGRSALHWASLCNNVPIIEQLIEARAELDVTDKEGQSPLHIATINGNRASVEKLIEAGANLDLIDNSGQTPLHLSIIFGKIIIAEKLLEAGAKLDLKNNNGRTALGLAEDYEYTSITQKISHKLWRLKLIEMELLVEQSNSVGLEMVEEEASPSCSKAPPLSGRDLTPCVEADRQDHDLFPYEPLEERVSIDQRQAAKLASQVAMALAWQQRRPLDSLLRYQCYLGIILGEGEGNQSPREQQLLQEHYQRAKLFFQKNPENALLEAVPDDFEPSSGKGVILESGQHTLLIFNQGKRYQLYSPDFNYQKRFQMQEGGSWSQLSTFIQAFFQWKTGSQNYHSWVLKQDFPVEAEKTLLEGLFGKPDNLVPDSVLLCRERAQGIEKIPLLVVRALVRVNGQVVDPAALHADFFQQTAGIQLWVENLHAVLAELNQEQQHRLVQVVRKYHWSADSTLLETLFPEAQLVLADYQQRVMHELTKTDNLTPEHLSELSFQALNQAFKRFEIPEEFTQPALAHLKQFMANTAQRARTKGVATQSLFFLPDMFRAPNTGNIDGSAATVGRLSTESTLNDSHEKWLEQLQPLLSKTRFDLLKKVPTTSPVFKVLTLYLIVDITQQLQKLPPDSDQRQAIKYHLGEQFFNASQMIAQLLGIELKSEWIGSIAEQLLFEALIFRKEKQLDIPFWEAFIINLVFEQRKLQLISEEHQLVALNLANVNALNDHSQLPYGWVFVKVPALGAVQWQGIDEQQIPLEVRQQVANQPETLSFFNQSGLSEGVREAVGFRQISRYQAKAAVVGALEIKATKERRLMTTSWKRANYPAHSAEITVDWSTRGSGHQGDSIFLDQPGGAMGNYQQIVTCSKKVPFQISGSGLATLYMNKHNLSNENAQRNLYLGFDPREGNITLLIHPSGLQELDKINQHDNADFRTHSNDSYSLTVQVGPKGYPTSILFNQSILGRFSVEEYSQRLHTSYFINSDSAPFYLYDDATITRLAISPAVDRRIGFFIQNDDPTILWLQPWGPNSSQPFSPRPMIDRTPGNFEKSLHSLMPQRISILHFPNHKKYLQLMLEEQEIVGGLTLSAEHVEVLAAKGREVYQSGIRMDHRVDSFTVTLRGHVHISQGNTHLYFFNEAAVQDGKISYSKPPSAAYPSLYRLEFDTLQLKLDSLSKNSLQETRFSIAGLRFAWIFDLKPLTVTTMLQVIGHIDGQRAQLLLEHNRRTFSYLNKDPSPLLVVDHDTSQAELDNQLVFRQVITREQCTQSVGPLRDSYPAVVDIIYPDEKGDILWFQSVQGYPVIHRFPKQKILTLNGIYYQVESGQLVAVGAPNGVIYGDQLIRYRTPTRRVAIQMNSTLTDSQLSLEKDSITINQLTLRYLSNQDAIYFGEQGFTLQALKARGHAARQRRDLHRAEPLPSGAVQNKPWFSDPMKQAQILLGEVYGKWLIRFPFGKSTASPSQGPPTLDAATGQPLNTPQSSTTYTSGHFQGLLQLLDLGVRRWMGRQYDQPSAMPTDSLAEARAQALIAISLLQQWVGFSSRDHLTADPYRGHSVNTLSTPQRTANPINSD